MARQQKIAAGRGGTGQGNLKRLEEEEEEEEEEEDEEEENEDEEGGADEEQGKEADSDSEEAPPAGPGLGLRRPGGKGAGPSDTQALGQGKRCVFFHPVNHFYGQS